MKNSEVFQANPRRDLIVDDAVKHGRHGAFESDFD
jgi:hypothetical protein